MMAERRLQRFLATKTHNKQKQEPDVPTICRYNGTLAGQVWAALLRQRHNKTGMLDEYFESLKLEGIDHKDSAPSTITDGNKPLHPSSLSQESPSRENAVQMLDEQDLQSLRRDLSRYDLNVDKNGRLIHEPSHSKRSVSSSSMVMRTQLPPLLLYPYETSPYSQTISEEQRYNWISKPIVYACPFCHLLFDDFILHYMHMQAHTRQNPFTCWCGYKAETVYQFNAHIFTSKHSFIIPKPFSCSKFPSVPYHYRKAWLARAILYECPLCKILFENKILHRIHMYAHAKHYSYECVCGFDGGFSKCSFNSHFINAEHVVSEELLFGVPLPKK